MPRGDQTERAALACFVAVSLAAVSCSKEDPPELPPSPPQASQAVTPGVAPSAGPRDVAVLVLEERRDRLAVLSSSRVPASRLGKARHRNGAGRPTHRWRLVDGAGLERAAGTIA